MDVDAQPVGVQPARVADVGQPVDRVERRLRVQHHPPGRIDRLAPGGEQLVDILLLDPVAAQLDLDRGDVAHQPAG